MRRFVLSASFVMALLFVVAQPTFAQQPAAIITGTVVDDSTGTPLAGAHVFIASSLIGTTTDGEGRYRLERVPLGNHRLYVSIIGFDPQPLDVALRESRVYTYDFRLNENILELEEVTVEAKQDRRWKQRLERFTTLFIGETPYAKEVTIKNPEVLDFEGGVGHLEARASDILIIENKALGYRIQYFLKDFKATPTRTQYDGEPLYEEMEPDSPEQQIEWEANRRKAFIGSFRHFMLAALAGQLEQQGFKTYSRPAENAGPNGPQIGRSRAPFDFVSALSPGETPNEKELAFDGFVEIIFMGETEDDAYYEWQQRPQIRGKRDRFQTSWINQERGAVPVDYKGDMLNPYGVTLRGYWAFERVADEVPKEYRPR